jgi:hypothetical protein
MKQTVAVLKNIAQNFDGIPTSVLLCFPSNGNQRQESLAFLEPQEAPWSEKLLTVS